MTWDVRSWPSTGLTNLRRSLIVLAGLASCWMALPTALAGETVSAARPNVLFIAIDDLNDWVGCLDGHPDAKTPNIDRLARRGALFTNAHCAAPVCNPSRTATLFGVPPAQSGVYLNQDPWMNSERLQAAVPLPQIFRQQGYHTMGIGKLFHSESASFRQANWDADGGQHTAYGYNIKVDGFIGFPDTRRSTVRGRSCDYGQCRNRTDRRQWGDLKRGSRSE